MRQQNREAARAGAQIERALDAQGVGNPWLKPVGQQLGDIRAWNDDALVDIETKLPQPGFVRKVRGRDAIIHPALDDLQQLAALDVGEIRVEKRLETIERQVQRMQDDIGCFVVGAGQTMAEAEATGDKPGDGVTKPVAHGPEILGQGGHRCWR